MKKLLLLLITLSVHYVQGQISYSTKTSYKYDKIEGWVRIVESAWFTINSNGDTTHWTERKEDTQQEDPGVKTDSIPILIPSSVFVIGKDEIIPDTVTNVAPLLLNIDTFSYFKVVSTTKTVKVEKVKVKKIVKYKTKWRNKKHKIPKIKPAKTIKEPPAKPINIITYKKKLWCIYSKSGVLYVVEANTSKEAVKKLNIPYLVVTILELKK